MTTNNPNWEKIARGKCKTLFLVEAYKIFISGKSLFSVSELEKQAEMWADMAMRSLAEVDAKKSDADLEAEIAKKSVNELFGDDKSTYAEHLSDVKGE